MTEIPQLTMICVDCVNHGGAIAAIKKSLQQIKPARTVFITDRQFNVEGVDVVVIPKIKSKREYSHFIIKELYKYFDTTHCLVMQADGYVLNGECWNPEILEYDYVGAPWNFDFERQVGNGGFSIRSKKLQQILAEDHLISVTHPEDQSICIVYKFYLEEKYGINFCSVELAEAFSYELREPLTKTFGFHGNFWPPFQETVVITREGALGDVIALEPILHHFWMKGYRVVLNTLPQFYELFRAHYFPIAPFGQLNPRIPYTEYRLDMAYESDPRKLHLKAYYEFCGVPEHEQIIRNPKLNFIVDKTNTLFPKKYVALHIDKRAQPGRNIYGIDWAYIVNYLESKGYTVIQIGKGECVDSGAIRMQTLMEPMMAYLIAGAECVIGCDSGPMNVAAATGRKCIVFHGAVDPEFIYPDRSQMKFITKHSKENPICDKPYCWHSVVGCEGVPCYIDSSAPPCSQYKTEDLLNAINEML